MEEGEEGLETAGNVHVVFGKEALHQRCNLRRPPRGTQRRQQLATATRKRGRAGAGRARRKGGKVRGKEDGRRGAKRATLL